MEQLCYSEQVKKKMSVAAPHQCDAGHELADPCVLEVVGNASSRFGTRRIYCFHLGRRLRLWSVANRLNKVFFDTEIEQRHTLRIGFDEDDAGGGGDDGLQALIRNDGTFMLIWAGRVTDADNECAIVHSCFNLMMSLLGGLENLRRGNSFTFQGTAAVAAEP